MQHACLLGGDQRRTSLSLSLSLYLLPNAPFQINNPDKRVESLKKFALDRNKFKQETPLLEYALKVEQITTAKVGLTVHS
jgi:hypothetical protein